MKLLLPCLLLCLYSSPGFSTGLDDFRKELSALGAPETAAIPSPPDTTTIKHAEVDKEALKEEARSGAEALLARRNYSRAPYTNRKQLMLISEPEEVRLGIEAYSEILYGARISTDTEKTEMVRQVGDRLAGIANAPPGYEWEFNLIEDPQINAFCLPGGKVAVYSALLPVAEDETGLAVVMGHEIAHALARHGSERISREMVVSLGDRVLKGTLVRRTPETQEAFSRAYKLGMKLCVTLPFSRDQESEADHIGLILMAKAGHDPRAALEFWKRMEAAATPTDSHLAKYLSAHPGAAARIKDIKDWMPEAMKYYKTP
ncbi:MAG: M48 family metallopeptidase [Elusimicrobiales bacterium]